MKVLVLRMLVGAKISHEFFIVLNILFIQNPYCFLLKKLLKHAWKAKNVKYKYFNICCSKFTSTKLLKSLYSKVESIVSYITSLKMH